MSTKNIHSGTFGILKNLRQSYNLQSLATIKNRIVVEINTTKKGYSNELSNPTKHKQKRILNSIS